MMYSTEMKEDLKFRFNMIIKIMKAKSDSTNLFNESLISIIAIQRNWSPVKVTVQ